MYPPIQATTPEQEAIALILKYIPANAIYIFGKRRTLKTESHKLIVKDDTHTEHCHLYILVFSQDIVSNFGANTCDFIRSSTEGRITATILLHKPSVLKPRSSNLYYFFITVMRCGEQVHQDTVRPIYYDKEFNIKRDFKASRLYWSTRFRSAQILIASEYQIEHSDAEALKITFLNQAVILLCLGIIEVFTGYRPNHFSLGFLFELCDYFCDCAADCFPRESTDDQKLFKLLRTPPHILRHKVTLDSKPFYTEILELRCQRFLSETAIVAEAELQKLENANH